jgi:PilZ domain
MQTTSPAAPPGSIRAAWWHDGWPLLVDKTLRRTSQRVDNRLVRWRKRAANPAELADEIATVVEHEATQPVVWEGRFSGRRPDTIRLALTDEFPFGVGDNLVVTAGRLGTREWAFARLKGLHGAEATLKTLSPWVPINRRESERYAVDLPALVSTRIGDQRGRLLDVSVGGVAFALPAAVAVGVSAVVIGNGDDAPALPVRVVAVDRDDDGVVLHAQFGTLNIAGHEFVARLVRELHAHAA